MRARWYMLYKIDEDEGLEWKHGVTQYGQFYPKQLKRMIQDGWRVVGDKNGERLDIQEKQPNKKEKRDRRGGSRCTG